MSIATTAQKLIHQHGKAITFVAVTPGAYNPATSSAALVTTSRVVSAIIGHIKRQGKDGLAVQADASLTLAALDFPVPPKTADRFSIGAAEFAVVSVSPEYHGEDAVTYIVQGRRT